MNIIDLIGSIANGTVIAQFFQGDGWMRLVMIIIGCVFLFLAIKKDFEPYLPIPIAFGIILVNIFPEIYITYSYSYVDAEGVSQTFEVAEKLIVHLYRVYLIVAKLMNRINMTKSFAL